jgi:hypothetical protein
MIRRQPEQAAGAFDEAREAITHANGVYEDAEGIIEPLTRSGSGHDAIDRTSAAGRSPIETPAACPSMGQAAGVGTEKRPAFS